MTTSRRLAAIVATDVVGYSRLMGADEEGTRAAMRKLRDELWEPKVEQFGGRIVKTTGDGQLLEFPSVVDALKYSAELQQGMAERNKDTPETRRIVLRVGVNLGDVIVEGEDIHGDGVNVAARLEGLAEPGGICVSGMVHEAVRNKLDLTFDDLGEQEVKNIAEPVRVFRVALREPLTQSASEAVAPPLPDKPSIAVLAFDNMSGDPEQEYFSDGIAEDIITALSRFRSLFVIARNSSFTYKDRAVDVKQVSAELGVRYVLEGSVRKAGSRVRITAQLVDGTTGAHLWAERYDRDLDDIFALQDEITETIVAAIEPELGSSERKRAQRKPPESLDAWECYQRGMLCFYQFTRSGFTEARGFFNRAIELDPNFGSAYAALAISDGWAYNAGFIDSPEFFAENLRLAQRAVALDERNPLSYRALASAYTHQGDHDSAIAAVRSGLALNPSYADAIEDLGIVLARAARYEEAIELLERAIRLNPISPQLWNPMSHISTCLALMKRYEEAVEWARKSIRAFDARLPSPASGASPDDLHSPNFWTYAQLASALGHLGRTGEAKVALDEMLRRRPDFSREVVLRLVQPPDPNERDDWFEGLRKAGWRE